MSNILFKKTIEKFKKDKIACLSLFFFIIFTIFIFSVSYFFDKNYFSVQNPDFINCAPSKGHIFGTDTLGRDLFIRTIVGSQISLIIAFIAAIIAGYFAIKWMLDLVQNRSLDIFSYYCWLMGLIVFIGSIAHIF